MSERAVKHPVDFILESPNRPRSTPATRDQRAARAAAWAALIDGGLTLTDVANAVGLSRERIRQVLRAHGHATKCASGSRACDPVACVSALRDSRSLSLTSTARWARTSPHALRRLLQELGLWNAANRLWRARTSVVVRRQIVRAIKQFAHDAGKAPRLQDAHDGRLFFAASTIIRTFGTWNGALRSAGFEVPPRGRRHRLLL